VLHKRYCGEWRRTDTKFGRSEAFSETILSTWGARMSGLSLFGLPRPYLLRARLLGGIAISVLFSQPRLAPTRSSNKRRRRRARHNQPQQTAPAAPAPSGALHAVQILSVIVFSPDVDGPMLKSPGTIGKRTNYAPQLYANWASFRTLLRQQAVEQDYVGGALLDLRILDIEGALCGRDRQAKNKRSDRRNQSYAKPYNILRVFNLNDALAGRGEAMYRTRCHRV
jgi:hypothetical protein